MTPARDPEAGVILINVLVIVALSSTILFAMLRLSDTAITRSQRYGDAIQANALIDGGEITAISALRRDDPQVDYPGEAWATIDQSEIAIAGGSFSLAIADASGKFNLTNLRQARPEDAHLFGDILNALNLPEATGLLIITRLADSTPIAHLQDFQNLGLSAADIQSLSELTTILPQPTAININTMPDAMFAVLAANPVQARLLQGLRERTGRITRTDFLNAGLILPTQIAETSAFFRVTTTATIGTVRITRESLLARTSRPPATTVIVIARRVPQ